LPLSSIHEVGAHGYYHKAFVNLSREEAIEELYLISKSLKKLQYQTNDFYFSQKLDCSS
jgi:peptidoglycan/xylan/chitin deacetylase (PgdA/CDA1 family)